MNRRFFTLISLLTVLGILAAACAQQAEPTAPPVLEPTEPEEVVPPPEDTEAPQEVTTITWLTLGWPAPPTIEPIFEAANPDINLEVEQLSFADMFEQIQVRLGANSETPDVISVDVPVVASYGIRGWLLPVDEAFTAEERADWLESSNRAGQYQGQLLAPAMGTSTQLLYMNLDMFAEAGLTAPGPDDRLTWEQLADLANQLTKDMDGDGTTDVYGFIWEQITRIYQLQPMPMSLGGLPLSPDGLAADGFVNSQAWVDAFTYYSKAFNEWGFAPKGDVGTVREMFQNQKLAMFLGGATNIKRIMDSGITFNWNVSRHPYFEGGEIVTPTGSWHIGVNARSLHPEAATRFVHWISTGEGAEEWFRASGEMPAQQSVLSLINTDPSFQEGPMSYWKVAVEEATVNPQPRPLTPGYMEYQTILDEVFSDIRNGADVQEALNSAVARIDTEMAKYK